MKLSDYQKQLLQNNETIRFAPFEFFQRRKYVKNIWWRLSIIFLPIFWIFLTIGFVPNFLITGSWGYGLKVINWYDVWKHKIGL